MPDVNKKSILLIMPYGSVGGMERLALTFYNYYKKKGYEVKALKFIKLDTDIINFGEDELFLQPIDFSFMSKIERLLFYFKAPLKIRQIIKNHKVTHSIAFGDMANFFSSLSFSKEFKVGSIHALKSVELNNPTLFNRLTRLGYKSSYKHLDKLVCISKAIKDDLLNKCGYQFSNLEIIYNPHNVDELVKLSKEPITDKHEINIFSKPTILFLGRLSIQKATWHLIKAFYLLQKKNQEVNLVLIGDGDKIVTEYVQQLISELGIRNKVFLLGRKTNPYKYIAASNVLALSSYYEGTPNVIVESISIGTPIVSSYCTKGIIELMSTKDEEESNENIIVESGIVTPNFFKGSLAIPKNNSFIKEEEFLAEALNKVIENKEFSNNLEKHKLELLSKFDLKVVAEQYITVNKTNS